MTTRIVLLPILDDHSVASALRFGHRCAEQHQAILQLLYLNNTGQEETPEQLIDRLGLVSTDLFNAVVSIVDCQELDCEKVILTTAARPEVELLVLANAPARQPLISRLFDQVSCPVAVSQQEYPFDKPIQRVVVPLDGTPSSAAAIEPALRFAIKENAQLHVLHIAGVCKESDEPGTLAIGTYMDQPHYEWPMWMREFWDRFLVSVKALAPHIKPQLHVSQGDVCSQIEQFARAVDGDLVALAVGTDKALAHRLMRELNCPLLLVRPGATYSRSLTMSKPHAA